MTKRIPDPESRIPNRESSATAAIERLSRVVEFRTFGEQSLERLDELRSRHIVSSIHGEIQTVGSLQLGKDDRDHACIVSLRQTAHRLTACVGVNIGKALD